MSLPGTSITFEAFKHFAKEDDGSIIVRSAVLEVSTRTSSQGLNELGVDVEAGTDAEVENETGGVMQKSMRLRGNTEIETEIARGEKEQARADVAVSTVLVPDMTIILSSLQTDDQSNLTTMTKESGSSLRIDSSNGSSSNNDNFVAAAAAAAAGDIHIDIGVDDAVVSLKRSFSAASQCGDDDRNDNTVTVDSNLSGCNISGNNNDSIDNSKNKENSGNCSNGDDHYLNVSNTQHNMSLYRPVHSKFFKSSRQMIAIAVPPGAAVAVGMMSAPSLSQHDSVSSSFHGDVGGESDVKEERILGCYISRSLLGYDHHDHVQQQHEHEHEHVAVENGLTSKDNSLVASSYDRFTYVGEFFSDSVRRDNRNTELTAKHSIPSLIGHSVTGMDKDTDRNRDNKNNKNTAVSTKSMKAKKPAASHKMATFVRYFD